jgi:hypothetical protein
VARFVAPNQEPWCRLECGCITSPAFSTHKIGELKNGKRVWRQTCETTGEWLIIGLAYYQSGGRCIEASRLF